MVDTTHKNGKLGDGGSYSLTNMIESIVAC